MRGLILPVCSGVISRSLHQFITLTPSMLANVEVNDDRTTSNYESMSPNILSELFENEDVSQHFVHPMIQVTDYDSGKPFPQ